MSYSPHQMPSKAALVNYGYAGKLFHAAPVDATPGLHLQVIGPNRPDAVHAERPDATVCTPEIAVTHADTDFVVVATSNSRYASLVKAALRMGKHVVVDRLFTVTLAETRHLARAARDAGCVLPAFQSRRWDSNFLAMRIVIGGGAPGEAIRVETHFDRCRPQVRARWHEQARQGTGIWFDLDLHLIDQAL